MRTDTKEPVAQSPCGRRPHFVCILLLAGAALLLAGAASASAAIPFGGFGSEAGKTNRLKGLAVDASNGRVYVADYGNHRIDVFDSSGEFLLAFGWGVADGTTHAAQTCTSTCFAGVAGPGSGQLDHPRWVAVDNNPTSPSYQDIYVSDENLRVQKFNPAGEFILMFGGEVNKSTGKDICTAASGDTCGGGVGGAQDGRLNGAGPLGVGPGGSVYVGDGLSLNGGSSYVSRIERFDASGGLLGVSALAGSEPIRTFAVDSGGGIYLTRRSPAGTIEKFEASEPSATLLSSRETDDVVLSLAIDGADNLVAAQATWQYEFDFPQVGQNPLKFLTEFSPSGEVLRRFGYAEIEYFTDGIALYRTATTGYVFYGESYFGTPTPGNQVIRVALPPPGPVSCCAEATSIGNTEATLSALVNPEGKATTYHFDYVDEKGFEEGGFAGSATKSTSEAAVGSDFTLQRSSASVSVSPETNYHFRLVATNADGKVSSEGEFKSLPALEVDGTWATDVGTDAASLHAEINPLGIPAEAYFQYVDDDTYDADVEAGGLGHGFDHATDTPDVTSGTAPLNLGSGKSAKRIGAFLDSLSPGTTYHYRVVAADQFLSVFGEAQTLRTFPVPSQPSNPCPNSSFRIGPSAGLPDCRAYEMVSPVDKNGGEIKVLVSSLDFPARLERSSTDGNRFAFSSVTSFGDSVSAPWASEYLARRVEGQGWSTHAVNPPWESESHAAGANITQRFDNQFKAFSSDLSSAWLYQDSDPPLDECAPEGFPNLYRRDNTTGSYEALTISKPSNTGQGLLELEGTSADGSHAVFGADSKMTANAATNRKLQLYEHIKGEGCGELRLVSVLPNGKASAVSSIVGRPGLGGQGVEARKNTVTHAVSADGSRIFWTAGEEVGGAPLYVRVDGEKTIQLSATPAYFWTAAEDGSKAFYTTEGNLYEFDTAKALNGEPASTMIAEGVPGVAGASDDASRVYFVSMKELKGEGTDGKPNLYLLEGGTTRLIATLYAGNSSLPGGDLSVLFNHSPFAVVMSTGEPIAKGVRVTADGRRLAFVSAERLTGYDNTDAVDGQPDLEVYLYTVDTGKVTCVSCNPSGARPTGREFKGANDARRRVSAQMAPYENQFTAPRALSDGGNRLFFESYESLLARDTNGKEDVYEWQQGSGTEDCEKAGAELYVPGSGGCLSLISTGQSPSDSELADASPDGSDVFIRTSSSLLPQDPGQVDVYDARENGGLPQPPIPPASCEGEACQGPLAPPNDPTPGSSSFEGAGNVVKKPTRKKARNKRPVKKKHKREKRADGKRRAGQ